MSDEIRPIPIEYTWAPSDSLWFWTRTVPFLIFAVVFMSAVVLRLFG